MVWPTDNLSTPPPCTKDHVPDLHSNPLPAPWFKGAFEIRKGCPEREDHDHSHLEESSQAFAAKGSLLNSRTIRVTCSERPPCPPSPPKASARSPLWGSHVTSAEHGPAHVRALDAQMLEQVSLDAAVAAEGLDAAPAPWPVSWPGSGRRSPALLPASRFLSHWLVLYRIITIKHTLCAFPHTFQLH